jgi:hypothetical protein
VVGLVAAGAVAASAAGGGSGEETTPPTTTSTSTTTTSTTTTESGPTPREVIEPHVQEWASLDDCTLTGDRPTGATAHYECTADIGEDESFEFGWLAFDSISSLDDHMDEMSSQATVVERGPWNFGEHDVGEYVLYDQGDGSGGMVWSFDDDLVVGYLVSDLGHERADELWSQEGNAGVA